MYFKEIEIRNFRNYEYCKESFHPSINIFIGENGQGKTSLAEALYIMCLGRSFRTQKDREMIRFGEETSVVRTTVFKNERNVRTEIILNRNEKKTVKINGVRKKRADLAGHILVVEFSPDDLKILKEEPDKRRRFLNREISKLYPGYYEDLAIYTKILLQRNTLLKEGNTDPSLLSVWNAELIKYGVKLIMRRESFIRRLNEISSRIHREITEGKEELSIGYDANVPFDEDPETIEIIFQEKMEAARDTDLLRGITSCGPHRDDLKVTINGIDVRRYGSQGQQRTAAIAIKLAEIQLMEEESGEKPVLILDDALSELDKSRQRYLIEALTGTQIFLTAASVSREILEHFPDKKIFEISDGKILPYHE
ncbi:MAG: DNA replication/repair protein RecF [Firmicutes bacterium]|nr:DNA replication/repair protein RecF [Bacillota bacterium]